MAGRIPIAGGMDASKPKLVAADADALRRLVRDHAERAAFLFDLDGTLTDTMPLHRRAYQAVFSAHGAALATADFDRLVGPPARVTIPRFMAAAGMAAKDEAWPMRLHAEKKQVFETMLAIEPLPELPALAVLRDAAGERPIAVVTSGNRRGAEAILGALGIASAVDVLVTSDDVAQGKPDPEPYRRGLSALGVEAEHALAFEDHDDGITSARAAGLRVIDVRRGEMVRP